MHARVVLSKLLRLCAHASLALAAAACAAAPRAVPGTAASTEGAGAARDSLHIRVLATHDFHGALRPVVHAWSNGRPVGGITALRAVLDSAEARCACPTLRLDGGDQMQGSLESNLVHGASVVHAFNWIGLDAAAVGNHELDWGVDTLLARQRQASYAWLAANVFRVADGERPEWATPFTIIDRDGISVAVIGYATVNTPRTLRPAVTAPYEFRRGVDAIGDVLDEVRRHEPDFTIIVAHAGGDCHEDGCTGEMVELAAELPPGAVHLIVGGHAHSSGEGVVNAVPIVRAGAHGRAVAVVDLVRRRDGSRAHRSARDTAWADVAAENPAATALLQEFAAVADAMGRARVTTLAQALPVSGSRRLGHFIADAARSFADADVGMHNPGGVRADLPAGVVTYTDLYSVLPFGNAVVRLTLSGRQLRQLVEQTGVRYYFSNLHVHHDPQAPAGRRIVSLTFADGSAIMDDRNYTLATSDFLADGGDGLAMLVPLSRQPSGMSVLDAVVARLRSLPAPVLIHDDMRVFPIR
jgi:2',3'-cyclic-nucleotide 2'-phosphodiesterase (5'-nucleotidase family)